MRSKSFAKAYILNSVYELNMVPLFELNEGEFGEIVEILDNVAHEREHGRRGRKHICQCEMRINDLGLRVGKRVMLLQKPSRGHLLIKVDDSRIAIGRGIAERIQVQ